MIFGCISVSESNPGIKKLQLYSRQTFYAHYRDLYDLIAEDEQEAMKELGIEKFGAIHEDPQGKEELYERILQRLEENEKLYRYYFRIQEKNYQSIVVRDIA